MMVTKLSGFAKFELDTKITKVQFYHLVEEASMVPVAPESEEKQFSEELFNQISENFSKALNPETASPPYSGDLENQTYLKIL